MFHAYSSGVGGASDAAVAGTPSSRRDQGMKPVWTSAPTSSTVLREAGADVGVRELQAVEEAHALLADVEAGHVGRRPSFVCSRPPQPGK